MRTMMATAAAVADDANVWGFVLEVVKALGVGMIGLLGALVGASSARKTSREQFDAQRLAAREDRTDKRADARRDEKLRLYSLFWDGFFVWHVVFERSTRATVDFDELWAAYEKWRPSQYAPSLVSGEVTSAAIRTLHTRAMDLLDDAKRTGAFKDAHKTAYHQARSALLMAMRAELDLNDDDLPER